MSSSKIFKKDEQFTPVPLVQHQIAARESEIKNSAIDSPPNPHPSKAKPVDPEPTAPQIDLSAVKKEAYNQGMKDMAAQLQAEFQHATKAFADACQKIDDQRKQQLLQSRGEIINLVITLSKKIVGQELSLPRNIIATTLQAALEQAIESEEYYVTLNPDDLAFAEEKVPDLIASIRGLERIIFKIDRNMTRGGCLLESTFCSVDAAIETQMESMKEFLEKDASALLNPDTE
jgi:flagellar assembly protein FliH